VPIPLADNREGLYSPGMSNAHPTQMQDAAYLLAEIAAGKTLRVCTCTRITEITPRTLASWTKAGHVILKNGAKTGRLLMASGNKFVDISLCALELES
jgi:hypothetical protein